MVVIIANIESINSFVLFLQLMEIHLYCVLSDLEQFKWGFRRNIPSELNCTWDKHIQI